MAEEVLTNLANGVATLTFNRPEVRNAMNPTMRNTLIAALQKLEVDSGVDAVVLRGTDGHFVAGGDVQTFAETLTLDRASRRENFQQRVTVGSKLISNLANSPRPLIAVIDGDAAGAGIGIALSCDFVLASRSSRLSFAHAHVGLALDLGLSYFLPRAVGSLQAKRLAMLGGRISAEEAFELGLITYLVDDDEVEEVLSKLLADIAKMPAPALSAIKQQFRNASNNSLADQLALESELVGDCAATEDFEQRVAAVVGR